MKKFIILLVFIFIIIITFTLGRYSTKNHFNYTHTQNEYNYFDNLCKSKYEELNNKYIGGELIQDKWKIESERLKSLSNYFYKNAGTSIIKKDSIDSYENFIKYYIDSDSYLEELINSLIKANNVDLIADVKFKIKMIEYVALNKMIQDRVFSYFQFDATGAFPIAKKDTIKLGQEYIAEISLYAHNSKYPVIGVLENGDTLPRIYEKDIFPIFKETPLKKGWVKHKGCLKIFHYGNIRDLPFEINYFVK